MLILSLREGRVRVRTRVCVLRVVLHIHFMIQFEGIIIDFHLMEPWHLSILSIP